MGALSARSAESNQTSETGRTLPLDLGPANGRNRRILLKDGVANAVCLHAHSQQRGAKLTNRTAGFWHEGRRSFGDSLHITHDPAHAGLLGDVMVIARACSVSPLPAPRDEKRSELDGADRGGVGSPSGVYRKLLAQQCRRGGDR